MENEIMMTFLGLQISASGQLKSHIPFMDHTIYGMNVSILENQRNGMSSFT